ncbi:hypothetical protein AVDCRST_MAG81-1706 [uncultured Synechococcales cyanobacterium]|uniref:Uncharacterized protein n=1 Tax=uncultured Synechococcales cyanobacterium TaxID=1936017 RepID=A0A6J4V985_9CYAN|nr:hypothetical protein AVDCRST_MAG81-1706 [uncultured Synechococcales cyanobacterium]
MTQREVALALDSGANLCLALWISPLQQSYEYYPESSETLIHVFMNRMMLKRFAL